MASTGSGANLDRDFTIIFQSSQEFDPKLRKIGSKINGKDFYRWTQDKSLIFERIGKWTDWRRKQTNIKRAKGVWLCALKWSGNGFRVTTIAVEEQIVEAASSVVRENLEKGKSLSLLSEYVFDLPQGTIMSSGTNLKY